MGLEQDVNFRGPLWFPDGEKIAFAKRDENQHEQIWVMQPDGSGLQQLTVGGISTCFPVWISVPDAP